MVIRVHSFLGCCTVFWIAVHVVIGYQVFLRTVLPPASGSKHMVNRVWTYIWAGYEQGRVRWIMSRKEINIIAINLLNFCVPANYFLVICFLFAIAQVLVNALLIWGTIVVREFCHIKKLSMI
jgi:hypothetical protein